MITDPAGAYAPAAFAPLASRPLRLHGISRSGPLCAFTLALTAGLYYTACVFVIIL